MSSFSLMPFGVDFGTKGGIVGIDQGKVVFYRKTPYLSIKYFAAESDLACERGKKSKAKNAKPRYKRTGELKPKNINLFDTDAIQGLLVQALNLATELKYDGIFALIEAPQTLIGKSHVVTYYSSGRCQNAWYLSLHKLEVPYRVISPITWKRALGLSSDKQQSIDLAKERFELPDCMLDDHDLCEAALLAGYLEDHASRYLR